MSTRELTILTDVSMITCVVQRDKADAVIAAAQEVGAQGATVHFGSGTGLGERLGLLGLAVDVEKEVITILCGDDQLDSIFEKMYFAGELDVPGGGIIYVTQLEKAATFVPKEVLDRVNQRGNRND